MFRHQGKSRTLKHNLRIATLLSFVAGIVNVTGFIAFSQLTTNVTGHFALLMNDVSNFEIWSGAIYFLYILSFLLGSFCSSLLIEIFRANQKMNVFLLPTLIEVLILISTPFLYDSWLNAYPNIVVCTLLFAMGLQNSFVTKISNAVVRTTHLTGLFTDLGIEFSQLFFPVAYPNRAPILATIKLRIYIISFFFLGGLVGGFLYLKIGIQLYSLILPAIILIVSLFYDDFRYRIIRSHRHYQQKKATKQDIR